MKRIEDIKEFKDIDTYYEISEIVEEVFQDRVEAHKHLITANKEIERLNNAFDCLEQVIRYYVIDNVKYDNNTAEYILNRMLTFWGKDSDKE